MPIAVIALQVNDICQCLSDYLSGNTVPLPSAFTEASAEEYTLRRILYGIPEGIDDLFAGASLPLESNMDYMSGGKVFLF